MRRGSAKRPLMNECPGLFARYEPPDARKKGSHYCSRHEHHLLAIQKWIVMTHLSRRQSRGRGLEIDAPPHSEIFSILDYPAPRYRNDGSQDLGGVPRRLIFFWDVSFAGFPTINERLSLCIQLAFLGFPQRVFLFHGGRFREGAGIPKYWIWVPEAASAP